MLPAGIDENDNAAMSQVYNAIDRYAEMLQASFILVHHSSKGSQSGKSVTDVGSGAGAISRAADAHLILRPHEEPNCAVFESAVRSWPPVEPRCSAGRSNLGPEDSLDPSRLKIDPVGIGPKRILKRKTPGTGARLDSGTLRRSVHQPDSSGQADVILTAQEEADLSEHRTGLLLQAAISRGLVHVWKDGGTLLGYATQPMPIALTKSDRVRQLLLANPAISGREVEEQTVLHARW